MGNVGGLGASKEEELTRLSATSAQLWKTPSDDEENVGAMSYLR